MNPKIITKTSLRNIISKLKACGKSIVFTNGCFDVIHFGHVKYLKDAKNNGDVLIVGINSDNSLRRLKGKGRPIINEKDRAEILSAFACVDYVILFNQLTPETLIKIIKPDVLVKGSDYALDEIVGRNFVEQNGGKVKTIPLIKGRSTSDIIKKIKKSKYLYV